MWDGLAVLRRLAPPEHEFKVTPIMVTPMAVEYTTQLTEGKGRTGLFVYNNSNSASGECYWGDSTITQHNGMPIPTGAIIQVMIPPDGNPYFCSASGEIGDLRVLETS